MFNIFFQSKYKKLFNHIDLSAHVSYYNYNSKGDSYNNNNNNGLQFGIDLYGYYKNFFLNWGYIRRLDSPFLTGETLSYSSDNSYMQLGYKYKNWNFSANIYYLLLDNGDYYNIINTSKNKPFNRIVTINENSNMLLLKVRYNFKKGKEAIKKEKRINNYYNDSNQAGSGVEN